MLTEDALKCSPTRENVPSSEPFTADDLVAAQDALEAEARDALPFSFSQCTYDLGYIRQPVYACLTCLNQKGVCGACSISCHGEHHLVELFNRRNFRCDCGTMSMGAGSCCSISPRDDAPANQDNKYDKNFRGDFCFCGAVYDPQTETDCMYQCVVCEDWMHHSCLLGVPADSDDSILGQDDFDQVICGSCIKMNRDGCRRVIERYAGRDGTGVILVGGESGVEIRGAVLLHPHDEDDEAADTLSSSEQVADTAAGPTEVPDATRQNDKRKTDDSATDQATDGPVAKRARMEDYDSARSDANPTSSKTVAGSSDESSATSRTTARTELSEDCRAPPLLADGEVSPVAQEEQRGRLPHVFLQDGWQTRWCRCPKCLPYFHRLPYMLEEEETYEPPEDPDVHKSTLELGMEALARMPRAQAIEGAMAYQDLSQRLKAYFRVFSEQGITITPAIIKDFFDSAKET